MKLKVLLSDKYKYTLLFIFSFILPDLLLAQPIVTFPNSNNYYKEAKSYGTKKDTEPPNYVIPLNTIKGFEKITWLDVGLDYRLRYEHRVNDFRRSKEAIDDPFLLRTRLFTAIKNILDPLRFTLEIEDARRKHSQYSKDFDTRDLNRFEPIQAYTELYFDSVENLAINRPISLKLGRMAFEYADRRLIARNEWRNTTNNFQGARMTVGKQDNNWQADFLALKPVQRFNDTFDEVNHSNNFYGVLGDIRQWSKYVTIQPYYLFLEQDGSEVKYDLNGQAAKEDAKIDRSIHTLGIRSYGNISNTQLDYDLGYIRQFGTQQKIIDDNFKNLDHNAYAYNTELGYNLNHRSNPRLSAFYGVASGDKNPNDNENNRFERLFGFARPWSSSDYIQMENIVAPKVRFEINPILANIKDLKIDTTFSWYKLQSSTDRWNNANLQDSSGQSGNEIGKEFDIRIRFPINKQIKLNLGYAKFWAGNFTEQLTNLSGDTRSDQSNFFYTELSVSAF